MVAQGPFSVGDKVCFTIGTRAVRGVIVEDRGPIGVRKAHIYRVQVPNDPYEDEFTEMPEDVLSPSDDSIAPLPNSAIIQYLIHGGLTQILRSNGSGGKNASQVWLTRDSLGNVVHTFAAERGLVGGAPVPFLALHGSRIFKPKLEEVIDYLTTFGLSRDDARRVAGAVGTAP